jgi:hypothetical protein
MAVISLPDHSEFKCFMEDRMHSYFSAVGDYFIRLMDGECDEIPQAVIEAVHVYPVLERLLIHGRVDTDDVKSSISEHSYFNPEIFSQGMKEVADSCNYFSRKPQSQGWR